MLHEEERDTLKEWNNKKGFKVLFGIENQTIKDKKMPLRVIAYDGACYRSQMLKKDTKEFCKVITLILHFGDNQWKDDKELREVINQEMLKFMRIFAEDERFLQLDVKKNEDLFMSKYYSINKFSKILGVSAQTLRNWDKNGKLHPHHTSSNGYRYYSHEQTKQENL